MTAAAETAVKVDVAGLTDVGRKRKANDDHFVIAALQRTVAIRQTSLPGDYSEFALWGAKVPDSVAVAYGKGASPAFFRQYNGILYAPLTNTSDLRDVWGGILGTNTSGTNAAHPSVYYPVMN